MENNLNVLASKLGIASKFYDSGIQKCEYNVCDKIIRFFCQELGYKANTDKDLAESIQKFDEKSWKETIAPIYVLNRNNLLFPIYLKEKDAAKEIRVQISEQGRQKFSTLNVEIEHHVKNKTIGNFNYERINISIKDDLDNGYYDLKITCANRDYNSILAVTPSECYTTDDVQSSKLFGLSIQLYSLKSRRNWGVGDFTDLKNLIKICQKNRIDIIGLNPLNVLFHDFPENASPYSSISRLFLNPIYIDPEQTPGFDKKTLSEIKNEIAQIKSEELINYTKIYNLKIGVLKQLFEQISNFPEYVKKFEKFKSQNTSELDLLATYQALYHEQCQTVWGGCAAWEKELQNPYSLTVEKFKKAHQAEIEFFKFLQFEADRQLHEAHNQIKKSGLKIGLYRDLPVGVSKDSAEFWSDRSVFLEKSGAGAPPDTFFPCGQKWCLGAFNPLELKKRAYVPFIKILRANMAYAGALRIDHVMGLMRLFMIPDEMKEGTYLHYNFDDMLGLLALESHLHRCVIVGESIGNVPDGFMEKLKEKNIYSISVLWSERWGGGVGDFKMPKDYSPDAFVSIGTHDMPPLKMWWFGYEIELQHSLKMLTDEQRFNAYKRRENDRKMLLSAMDFNQVWPQDKLRQGDYLYGENYPQGLEEAAHTLLARSVSKVVLLQPEDIFQSDKLQNLPGTDRDKYPNWRRRLPVDLEDFETNEQFIRNLDTLRHNRG